MATTRTFAQVRSDFATRIAAISASWLLAPVPFALFGPHLVPDAIPASKAHLSFAIGVLDTARTDDRQRVSDGIQVASRVTVRFLARQTPKDKLTAEDAGFAAELALIQQALGVSDVWPINFQVLYEGSTRTMIESGEWAQHDVLFRVFHRLALT